MTAAGTNQKADPVVEALGRWLHGQTLELTSDGSGVR